jgi:branched-chain amino acid transport system permease protein
MGVVSKPISPPGAPAIAARARHSKQDVLQLAAGIIFVLLLLAVVPSVTNAYWLQTFTAAATFSVVALGLGLLIGRVGMVSLCQFALLALGGWVALRLGYATSMPFPVVLLATGLVTGVIGTVIGLPALRLSGLYLALITLMAAAAITVALAATHFPNGGGGFLGYSTTRAGTSELARPAIATTDEAYYRYVVVVAGAIFLLALAHVRTKPGRAWAAIRQSEPAALAAGVNITLYKLWAFALASFVTGIAGGLLAGSGGGLTTYQFPTENNITLLAAVLMGGAYNLWGAVVAAVFVKVLPALLQDWNAPADILLILFGVGVIQTLLTAPQGIATQLPKDLGKLAARMRGGRQADRTAAR